MTRPRLPIVPGPWLPLSDDERVVFLERLDSHLSATGLADPPFSQQTNPFNLFVAQATFYPGWFIVSGEASLPDGYSGVFDVLVGPEFLWCLNGESRYIHELNLGLLPKAPAAAKGDRPPCFESPLAPLEHERTGPDYLRFFVQAVHSDENVFRLIESLDDLRDCGVTDAERFAQHIRPLKMTPAIGLDAPLASQATLLYQGSLYDSRLQLLPDGQVKMLDDDALANDICDPQRARLWLRNLRVAAEAPACPG